MDSKGFHILSFKYAYEGVIAALKEEPNMKFHFLMALIVIILGFVFKISRTEWIIIILVTGLVLSVELTNTAIEAVVDGFTKDHHPTAKVAKDISAGAVLITAITASIVGILVFLPHLLNSF